MLNLEGLLAQRFLMPSVPRVVALLLTELTASHPDLRRIDQLLATDPALGLRVLQAANAPFFKLQGHIHSIAEALAQVPPDQPVLICADELVVDCNIDLQVRSLDLHVRVLVCPAPATFAFAGSDEASSWRVFVGRIETDGHGPNGNEQ